MARKVGRACRSSTKQENKFLNLVFDAVDMEKGKCVSRQKIIERVQKACRSQKNVASSAKIAIIRALESGMLVRTSGCGLNGSFRLSDNSNCQLISVTSKLFVEEASKLPSKAHREKSKRTTTMSSDVGLTKELHLKAILKTPRSSKASGFHVKFSSRGPKILWISPRPKRGRKPRLF
jgi:hypothetical protein